MAPTSPDESTPVHAVSVAAQMAEDVVSRYQDNAGRVGARDLADVVRTFRGVAFDVPGTPDADGFLFQYGPTHRTGEPTFVLGFVRQLEVLDGGEHASYSQVSVECRYPMDPGWAQLGARSLWWFSDGQDGFEQWLGVVMADPVWHVASRAGRAVVSVEQEVV